MRCKTISRIVGVPAQKGSHKNVELPMILKGRGAGGGLAVSHIVTFNETGIETPSGRVYIVVCYSKLGERWER